ncbi:MAG: toprim domain-containing protein, partial [Candidatus Micrarchaeaceae archaeon]
MDFVRERDGVDYRTARERLGLALPAPDPARPSIRPPVPNTSVDPPPARWRQAAGEFQGETAWWLWQPEGERALDYLHRRGFRDRAILQAGLGYNPQDRRVPREEWGLSPDPDHPIWLPRGIVIPWFVHGEIWRINIRRPLSPRQIEAGEPKYVGPAGWRNCLYNVDALDGERPAMLVEGELDALAVWQEAADVALAVATGSAGGGRSGGWLGRLAYAPLVLVAFDADDAGDKASAYWL